MEVAFDGNIPTEGGGYQRNFWLMLFPLAPAVVRDCFRIAGRVSGQVVWMRKLKVMPDGTS
jgi:hypothetical protein